MKRRYVQAVDHLKASSHRIATGGQHKVKASCKGMGKQGVGTVSLGPWGAGRLLTGLRQVGSTRLKGGRTGKNGNCQSRALWLLKGLRLVDMRWDNTMAGCNRMGNWTVGTVATVATVQVCVGGKCLSKGLWWAGGTRPRQFAQRMYRGEWGTLSFGLRGR